QLLEARLLYLDGKRADAKKGVAAVIAADPRSAAGIQAYMLLGQIETTSDRPDEAIKAYEEVLKLQPNPYPAAIALARLYLQRRNVSKATTYAQQALAMQPQSADAQSLLIRSKLVGGDIDGANHDLAELDKKFPSSVGVLKLTALVQLASNKPDAARASYER